MAARVSYVCGVCSRCGKEICRLRPADHAVCDCYKYCPIDHGKGPYGTLMNSYTPDMTPQTYGPLETTGDAWGDLKHPMNILYVCPVCNYHSAQRPVEVQLS